MTFKEFMKEVGYNLLTTFWEDFSIADKYGIVGVKDTVRASNLGNWNLHLFARVREEEYKYECLGGLRYKECIPYQGNEHLLGTNKSK